MYYKIFTNLMIYSNTQQSWQVFVLNHCSDYCSENSFQHRYRKVSFKIVWDIFTIKELSVEYNRAPNSKFMSSYTIHTIWPCDLYCGIIVVFPAYITRTASGLIAGFLFSGHWRQSLACIYFIFTSHAHVHSIEENIIKNIDCKIITTTSKTIIV